MNTETKKRGRPAGAKSTVNITLRQLNDLFPLDTAVPVGSVWLREYGVSVQAPAPLIVTEAAAETPAETPAPAPTAAPAAAPTPAPAAAATSRRRSCRPPAGAATAGTPHRPGACRWLMGW